VKSFLKNYFSFNKRDKNAFFILIVLLALIIIIPYASRMFQKNEFYDFTAFRDEILAFELAQKKEHIRDSLQRASQAGKFNYLYIDNSVEKSKISPFKFNPNNLSSEQWLKLGLTENQIKSIKNYEAKGGRFYIKSDFKKLYTISENEYEVLEPYIDLPESRNIYTPKKSEPETINLIELNNADSISLKSIKGIGNALSKRIVWYREKLGGYYKMEQLLEVEGIDNVLYSTITPYFSLEKRLVKQIDINEAEFIELKKHPYIGNNVALSLVNYRAMHGKYKSVADILKSALVTDEIFYKISPYLKVND